MLFCSSASNNRSRQHSRYSSQLNICTNYMFRLFLPCCWLFFVFVSFVHLTQMIFIRITESCIQFFCRHRCCRTIWMTYFADIAIVVNFSHYSLCHWTNFRWLIVQHTTTIIRYWWTALTYLLQYILFFMQITNPNRTRKYSSEMLAKKNVIVTYWFFSLSLAFETEKIDWILDGNAQILYRYA